MEEKTYYVAYGEGEAGMYTIYGLGATKQAALENSVQYGYDIEKNEPHLFIDELSEKAYNHILNNGGNDMEDDIFYWEVDDDGFFGKLMMREEKKIMFYVEEVSYDKKHYDKVDPFENIEDARCEALSMWQSLSDRERERTKIYVSKCAIVFDENGEIYEEKHLENINGYKLN